MILRWLLATALAHQAGSGIKLQAGGGMQSTSTSGSTSTSAVSAPQSGPDSSSDTSSFLDAENVERETDLIHDMKEARSMSAKLAADLQNLGVEGSGTADSELDEAKRAVYSAHHNM